MGEINTLQAILDTLVPRDETAGALDGHLDSKVDWYRKKHRTWRARSKRLITFCEALAVKEHSTRFSTLAVYKRVALLDAVLQDPQKIQFRMDLVSLRSLIFRWYYETESGRQSLNYRLPSEYPAYLAAIKQNIVS